MEASILNSKEIPLEILRQPETSQNEEIILFITKYNPNTPNIFPVIKQSFNPFKTAKELVDYV